MAFYFLSGAQKGTWTLKVLLPIDFESIASAVPPFEHIYIINISFVIKYYYHAK